MGHSAGTSSLPAEKDLLEHLQGRSGYLPCQWIEQAYLQGHIRSESPVFQSQFQPVSLDLRLGPKAYRIQCSFLPENETVEDKLKEVALYDFDLQGAGGVLEKGAIYLVPLLEEVHFPPGLFGLANPKSSTGRLDMFTRVIVDHGHRFDEIPPGHQGKLYLEIIPRSFPVRVKAGLSLNQLRVGCGRSVTLDKPSLAEGYANHPILFHRDGSEIAFDKVKVDSGLFLGVDLTGEGGDGVIAYKAKTNSSIIDLSKIHHYEPLEFWEPIPRAKNNRLILEPESFYIMMSKEKVCIWPHLLAEMVAWEPNSGELRTHYAGFFDPGFGWNLTQERRGQGTCAVMEVRPHDVPFMVEDGQTFCRLKFEQMVETPSKVYGKGIESHYHSQGLALSKYFKSG